MATSNRPLSPHLQVYRWQLTMFLSIAHRASGIALCAGIPFLLYWIWSLTTGEAGYHQAQAFFSSAFGRLVLLVLSVSLFFHLCNGVRHLYWDTGRGLDLPAVYRSGRVVLVATAVLTVIAWIAAYAASGGGA